MKKILFTLAGVMTLTLTSCFENTGYDRTNYLYRVVTINPTSNSVKFMADCTGEVFEGFTNLKYPEQLDEFGLSDVKRATVSIREDISMDKDELSLSITLEQAQKIDIQSVTNIMPTDSLRPFYRWIDEPLRKVPNVWIADGYLNVTPIILSGNPGKYYLMPDSVVGDTLHFSLSTSYEEDKSKKSIDELQCFDLRTLSDTANADPRLRIKMREAWDALYQHRNDSMRITLTGNFFYFKGDYIFPNDTVITDSKTTDYFKCEFIR